MKTKTLFAFVFSLALASSGSHAATVDPGSPISHTPYDRWLGPMWQVMHGLGGGEPSIGRVEELVRQASEFQYAYTSDHTYVPQTPRLTESTGTGDCKAKALWLAARMRSSSVRYVIGKANLSDHISHAWLMWKAPQGWLILDPSNYSQPLSPWQLSPAQFIPLYSYGPSGSYIHTMSVAARGARTAAYDRAHRRLAATQPFPRHRPASRKSSGAPRPS
jgi:hypothetical protein